MKRFLGTACVIAALGIAGAAQAQAWFTVPSPDHVFTTIDSVLRRSSQYLALRGVKDGASGPTEVQLRVETSAEPSLDSCERAALVLMSKPGQYKLEVWTPGGYSSAYCRLSLANP